ncbi:MULTISPECIES: helix-turn-helix domain-containing protein [unclassified Modestobacter]
MSETLTGLEALGPLSPAPAPVDTDRDAAAVGARVRLARTRRQLTGEQLGAALGLGKDQISKIERGKRRISVRELPKLAHALGVAAGELLGEASGPRRLALAHRLTAGAGDDVAATHRRALQLLEVEDVLALRAAPSIAAASLAGGQLIDYARQSFTERPRTRAEAQRQGRRLAERVREGLSLGAHEIGDLAGLIERNFGVDVAISPLGEDADGLCVHGEQVAMIVASSDFPDGHVRFTLAHELGHHLLADPRRDIIDDTAHDLYDTADLLERRVNAFAAHLLMPASGVRETLAWSSDGQVSDRALVALMQRFGVSLPALVHQLVELSLLTADIGTKVRRDCDEDQLVARHRDVSGGMTPTVVRRTVRAPERLLTAAIRGVQAEAIGLAPVAVLLERDDDDALWREFMEPAGGALVAGGTPGR